MLYPMLMAAAIAFTPLAVSPIAPADNTTIGMTENGSCTVPDVPAVVKVAAIPDMPFIAQLQHAAGTTYVQVDIDPSGAILNASIARSSGYEALDREAISATQLSQFRPEIKDCEPVGGSYLYEVEFPSE